MIRLLRPDYPVLVLSCLAFIVLFSVGLHGAIIPIVDVNNAIDATGDIFREQQPVAKYTSYPTSFIASNASLVEGNITAVEDYTPFLLNITLTNETREVNVTFRFQNISRPIPLAPNNTLSNYSVVLSFTWLSAYVTNSTYMEVLQFVDGNATTVSSWIGVPDLSSWSFAYEVSLEPTRLLDKLNVRFRFVYNDTAPMIDNFLWSLDYVKMAVYWRWENVPMKNLALRSPLVAADNSGTLTAWFHQQNEHFTVPMHDIDFFFFPCMDCVFGGLGPFVNQQSYERDDLSTSDITSAVTVRYIPPDIHIFFAVAVVGDARINRARFGLFGVYKSSEPQSVEGNYNFFDRTMIGDVDLRAKGACSNDTECLVVWSGRPSDSTPVDDRTIYAGITFLVAENLTFQDSSQYCNDSFIVNSGESDGFYDDYPTVASLSNNINKATMKSFLIAWETDNTNFKPANLSTVVLLRMVNFTTTTHSEILGSIVKAPIPPKSTGTSFPRATVGPRGENILCLVSASDSQTAALQKIFCYLVKLQYVTSTFTFTPVASFPFPDERTPSAMSVSISALGSVFFAGRVGNMTFLIDYEGVHDLGLNYSEAGAPSVVMLEDRGLVAFSGRVDPNSPLNAVAYFIGEDCAYPTRSIEYYNSSTCPPYVLGCRGKQSEGLDCYKGEWVSPISNISSNLTITVDSVNFLHSLNISAEVDSPTTSITVKGDVSLAQTGSAVIAINSSINGGLLINDGASLTLVKSSSNASESSKDQTLNVTGRCLVSGTLTINLPADASGSGTVNALSCSHIEGKFNTITIYDSSHTRLCAEYADYNAGVLVVAYTTWPCVTAVASANSLSLSPLFALTLAIALNLVK